MFVTKRASYTERLRKKIAKCIEIPAALIIIYVNFIAIVVERMNINRMRKPTRFKKKIYYKNALWVVRSRRLFRSVNLVFSACEGVFF